MNGTKSDDILSNSDTNGTEPETIHIKLETEAEPEAEIVDEEPNAGSDEL